MSEADRQPDASLAERERMIDDQLRRRGIRDPRVLDAMRRIPRERFLPDFLRDSAYDDRALPIDCGQTISQPYIVAYMTEQLAMEPDHRILEVGTGTGYQTSILSMLARHIFTIERIASLKEAAAVRLTALGVSNVTLDVRDGTLGWPEQAPFDRIIITAAAPRIPAALIDQLVENGVLVMPVGGPSEQTIVRVTRAKGRTVEFPLLACRFVKLVGEQGWLPGE